MAGLQEIRCLDSGEVSIGDTAFIWSEKNDGKRSEEAGARPERTMSSLGKNPSLAGRSVRQSSFL